TASIIRVFRLLYIKKRNNVVDNRSCSNANLLLFKSLVTRKSGYPKSANTGAICRYDGCSIAKVATDRDRNGVTKPKTHYSQLLVTSAQRTHLCKMHFCDCER